MKNIKKLSIDEHNRYVRSEVNVILNNISDIDKLYLVSNMDLLEENIKSLLEENIKSENFFMNPLSHLDESFSSLSPIFNQSLNSYTNYWNLSTNTTKGIEPQESLIEFNKRYFLEVCKGINEFLYEEMQGFKKIDSQKNVLKDDINKLQSEVNKIYNDAKEGYLYSKQSEFLTEILQNPEKKQRMDNFLKVKQDDDTENFNKKFESFKILDDDEFKKLSEEKREKYTNSLKERAQEKQKLQQNLNNSQRNYKENLYNNSPNKALDEREFQRLYGDEAPHYNDLKRLNIEEVKKKLDKINEYQIEFRRLALRLNNERCIDIQYIRLISNILNFFKRNKGKPDFNIDINTHIDLAGVNNIASSILTITAYSCTIEDGTALAKEFIELGGNFNLKDTNGDTHFHKVHIIERSSKSSSVKSFLDTSQVDLTTKNNSGKTVYDVLMEDSNEALTDYRRFWSKHSLLFDYGHVLDLQNLLIKITEMYNEQLKKKNEEPIPLPVFEEISPPKLPSTNIEYASPKVTHNIV